MESRGHAGEPFHKELMQSKESGPEFHLGVDNLKMSIWCILLKLSTVMRYAFDSWLDIHLRKAENPCAKANIFLEVRFQSRFFNMPNNEIPCSCCVSVLVLGAGSKFEGSSRLSGWLGGRRCM